MPQTLDFTIELSEVVSDHAVKHAEAKAREAAVLALQQVGELTIREAAAELALTYEGYLDLLADKGLPASYDDTDPGVIETLRQRMRESEGPNL